MITKKISRVMEAKLLGLIYDKYIHRFGHGVRNLGEFPIYITSAEVYLADMPELQEQEGDLIRHRFVDIMLELEASGYVEYDQKTSFFLTEVGYRSAAMTLKDKVLDFCNKNQGLAVPISVISLIISIIALWAGE
ncbi:hypothetical protein [Pseudomonas fluorescens]|uniref:hypothetical protein n=1 Tax=Pseudomonas fluorescens TaxID=294 RepID=UPI0028645E76|nr:hypothetical protein [Pseudomonas fluorescens]MDR6162371.1 hypothetical protein [Pseudomonas fluorescens]